MTSVDQVPGVSIVNRLLDACIARVGRPFLLASRIIPDLQEIRRCLETEVAVLGDEDLMCLLAVLFHLGGYEVLDVREYSNSRLYQLRTTGLMHNLQGFGALMAELDDLTVFEPLLSGEYAFGLVLARRKQRDSAITDRRLILLDFGNLVNHLMIIAVQKYAEIFAETLAAMPALKGQLLKVSIQESRRDPKYCNSVYQRWRALCG